MLFVKKSADFRLFLHKNSCNQEIFCNFAGQMRLSVRTHDRLLDLSSPRVMAIVNITPDSFYTSWGDDSLDALLCKVQDLLDQGADMLDLGACSTRPGSQPVSAQQEWARLEPALKAIRSRFPHAIVSVDTFRSEIAEQAIALGAHIINDVYGGMADERMWKVIAQHKVPYILTYSEDLTAQQTADGYDYTVSQMLDFFQSKLDTLHRMGVADVILDPGFGFGKSEQHNYTILREMNILSALGAPVLVGVSRKSMFYKPLGLAPSDVLPATIAANTIALERGAHILRVHDVAAAKQAIAIYSLTYK